MKLQQLREDLCCPDLSEGQALELFEGFECTTLMHETARLRYLQGYSLNQVAAAQGCTRGPVLVRLRIWRKRAGIRLSGGTYQRKPIGRPKGPNRLAEAYAALLALGSALADRHHQWSNEERAQWEKAERLLRELGAVDCD